MTTQHTPGPWAVDDTGYRAPGNGLCVMAWPECVAVVGANNPHLPQDANAHLIAAAPDLLEALKEIAADYADRFDLDDPSTNPGIKYTIKQARAAITKATGDTL